MALSINLDEFELEIDSWVQDKDGMQHLNIPQRDLGCRHTVRITTYDVKEPDLYYFTVIIEDSIVNDIKEPSFKAIASQKFKAEIPKNSVPKEETIFTFIDKATHSYSQEFYKKVPQTVLQHRKIPRPVFDDAMQKGILEMVSHWDKYARYTALQ
jgi:hypothetical protein